MEKEEEGGGGGDKRKGVGGKKIPRKGLSEQMWSIWIKKAVSNWANWLAQPAWTNWANWLAQPAGPTGPGRLSPAGSTSWANWPWQVKSSWLNQNWLAG